MRISDRLAWLEGHWRLAVGGAVAAALLLRLAIIALTGGGTDVEIYVYFGQLVLAGDDPYSAPAGGPVDPSYGDNPPLLVLLFAGLLWIRDSPDTLRVAFALADVATLLLIARWPGRSIPRRAGLIAFYGFCPLVLYSWTAHAQDKTLILLGLTVVLMALDRGTYGRAWLATGVLAAFKWVGAFWALPLALATLRARGARAVVASAGLFALAFALSHVPYLPSSLDAYGRRAERLEIDPPIHAGLLKPLSEIGLYAPWLARGLTLLAVVAVVVAFSRRRLSVAQAVVLSLVAAYLFLPDQSDTRVLLLVVPMLYVVRLDAVRYAWLWALSLVAAGALVVEQHDVPLVPGFVDALAGEYASLQHVVIINALLLTALAFLLLDVISRRRPPPPRPPAAAPRPG